jgi:hypothetical protein
MIVLRLPSPSRVQGSLFQYLLAIYLTYVGECQYKTYAMISYQESGKYFHPIVMFFFCILHRLI